MAYVESQDSFGIGDLGTRDVCLIAGRLQAPLPLMTTFEEIPDSNIELLNLVQIFPRKILRIENWDELGISSQSRIGAQIGGDLLGLILKN